MLTTNYQEALDKLQHLIDKGKNGATRVIEHVMNNQPQDRIVKAGATQFVANHEKKAIEIITPDGLTQGIHRNALGQMATVADVPTRFLDSLTDEKDDWGRELAAHNLQEVYHRRFANTRYLARSTNQQVRGWLSDKYRRLDSRPIVEAFASEVQALGAMPYEGHVTDTRIALQAIMPKIYEPITGELVAVGLSLENSDFGAGALSLRSFALRIWCDNLAITDETMRQIHLGKRLEDNVVYSERTFAYDTKTTVSALRDIVRMQLDNDSLDTRMAAVQKANETEVSSAEAHARLKKMLTKGEAEAAGNVYDSADVYNVPEGQNLWRLSNAISWIAGQTEDVGRKLDLMKFAGQVLPLAA